jgi:sialate O-acetylesterase
MRIIKCITQMWLCLLLADQANASIELPWLLSDGAVLQRDEPIPIWGTAAAGSRVSVAFGGETRDLQTDNEGNWQTVFPPRKAGGPYQLVVSGGGFSRTVDDILMGDLWVCSGQSNMEWVVRDSDGAEAEIPSVDEPRIRHFKVPRSWSVEPAATLAGGEWHPATPEYLRDFTAVGWYFAKRIHSHTGVPIGLINSTWGGSRIEAWMSPDALDTSPAAAQQTLAQLTSSGEARAREVKTILSRWPGALVDQIATGEADWSAAQLDDGDWLLIQVPGLWETQQFSGVDGILWYRKTFNLTQAEADAGMTLGLGRIDDNDITWVNGHQVGATNGYDEIRMYSVPARYLKPGENQLAIRVDDTGGGGGIYSTADLVYLETMDGKRRSLAGEWKVKVDKATVVIQDNMHHVDTALFNKMLHPLFKIPVKGVLWYQGESNANTAQEAEAYRRQFPALINDWRARWNNSELPFYWVQLANFISGNDTPVASPWALLREAQTAALALDNTGQAVIIDIGNPDDIHPTDKKTVGERLALIALKKTYGERKTAFRGPIFGGVKQHKNQLILNFTSSGKLRTRNEGGVIKGFEVAGEDGQFTAVPGTLRNNRVILPIQETTKATAVRYAWSDNPENANLIDATGLPAEPFRAEF